MKGITQQKEEALDETRQELERALHHIQLITATFKSSKHNSVVDFDNELSDDLSEEDDLIEQRRSVDIMSKLPIRPYIIHDTIYNDY